MGVPRVLGTRGPWSQLLRRCIHGHCPGGTNEVQCHQLEGLRWLRTQKEECLSSMMVAWAPGAKMIGWPEPLPTLSLVQRQGCGEKCPEIRPQASPSTASHCYRTGTACSGLSATWGPLRG